MNATEVKARTDLALMFWARHQRILRLQRDNHDKLTDSGRRFLKRCRTATFDDFADVTREAGQ